MSEETTKKKSPKLSSTKTLYFKERLRVQLARLDRTLNEVVNLYGTVYLRQKKKGASNDELAETLEGLRPHLHFTRTNEMALKSIVEQLGDKQND